MLWEAIGISHPGIVCCVGAGGKTSLIHTLAQSAIRKKRPVVVTTTTKMFYSQLAAFHPIVSDELSNNIGKVIEAVRSRHVAAWLARQEGDKAIGVLPEWIDLLANRAPDAYILVEADGARRCLIKAPAAQEPVIPDCTAMTVGVLNVSAIGQPLSMDNTHRLDLVSTLMRKKPGDTIGWQDVAALAVHRQGIFQYAKGVKVLLLSGGTNHALADAARIAGFCRLAKSGIARVVVTGGYGCSMQLIEVYDL